uniref:Uncharacterized protein n=1 Tax=Steinernema glaseri TaxID=37863 RepID=A0A1I8ATX2_9BILA
MMTLPRAPLLRWTRSERCPQDSIAWKGLSSEDTVEVEVLVLLEDVVVDDLDGDLLQVLLETTEARDSTCLVLVVRVE